MRLTWKREWTWILIVLLTLRVLYSVLGVMTISDGLPEALGAGESLFSAAAPLRTERKDLAGAGECLDALGHGLVFEDRSQRVCGK